MLFGGLFSPLVRFWAPFWTQLDPKGSPKIMFLGIMLENDEKMVSENEIRKTSKFDRKFVQNEKVWDVKMSVSLGTCCKIKVFGES